MRILDKNKEKLDKNKGISIITNFGCSNNCWYCIWKNHKLKDCKDPMDWDKLEQFLKDNQQVGLISISGGGDPFYNINNNLDWWNRIFSLTEKYNLDIEVHTRLLPSNYTFINKFKRIVLSIDSLDTKAKTIINYLYMECNVDIRLYYVVTKDTTFESIVSLLEYKNLGIEYTFKKLVGHDDNGNYEKFKNLYPNEFFLESKDYNIYYMPNNEIWDKFL
jgi:MoaA/NifB/PqqE/SkfB family radical SAM enzyme